MSHYCINSRLVDIETAWNYADPAGTEARFLAQLPLARQAGDAEYLAQLLSQIARSQFLQRRFADGHASVDEAERLLTTATPIARIRCLIERGRAWNDQCRFDEARARFAQAWELAQSAGHDAYAVDAAHMLGLMRPAEDAVHWNRQGIALAQRSNDPVAQRWIGTLLLNLGVKHQELAQLQDAEPIFQQAVQFYQQANNAPRVRLARLCLAKNQRLAHDPAGALALDQQLLAEMQAAGDPLGYACEEIAECLLALGRPHEAAPWFAQAHATLIAYPWYPPSEAERLERMRRLAHA